MTQTSLIQNWKFRCYGYVETSMLKIRGDYLDSNFSRLKRKIGPSNTLCLGCGKSLKISDFWELEKASLFLKFYEFSSINLLEIFPV